MVKFSYMNTSSENNIEKPNIVQALLSGFNTIANKPYLILLPVLLDLFLWFGPTWRIDNVVTPVLQEVLNLPGVVTEDTAGLLEPLELNWQDILTQFNLATALRTVPIGVPSLMISKPASANPIGLPTSFMLGNGYQFFGIWIIFILIGLTLGSLYFQNISKQISSPDQISDRKPFIKVLLQVVLMPILLAVILIIIAIPLSFLIALVSLLGPGISQVFVVIALMAIFWVVMPLIFTPHGIFMYHQNLIASMMTSISVVRVSMGQTAWFILISYVLIAGLDYLWAAPAPDNWLLLIGIVGHAFIVSAVVAASFYFFKDATRFTQALLNQQTKNA